MELLLVPVPDGAAPGSWFLMELLLVPDGAKKKLQERVLELYLVTAGALPGNYFNNFTAYLVANINQLHSLN